MRIGRCWDVPPDLLFRSQKIGFVIESSDNNKLILRVCDMKTINEAFTGCFNYFDLYLKREDSLVRRISCPTALMAIAICACHVFGEREINRFVSIESRGDEIPAAEALVNILHDIQNDKGFGMRVFGPMRADETRWYTVNADFAARQARFQDQWRSVANDWRDPLPLALR